MHFSKCFFSSIVFFAALLFPSLALLEIFGPVVSVLDGDTVEVLRNTYRERFLSSHLMVSCHRVWAQRQPGDRLFQQDHGLGAAA